MASTKRAAQSRTGVATTTCRTACCRANICSGVITGSTFGGMFPVVPRVMAASALASGVGMRIIVKKRSNWASGNGHVPSCSMGFCVANTWKGWGSGRVTPADVTVRSCIASSMADCVRGVARLSSSAKTT